jgi:hypothetical protein
MRYFCSKFEIEMGEETNLPFSRRHDGERSSTHSSSFLSFHSVRITNRSLLDTIIPNIQEIAVSRCRRSSFLSAPRAGTHRHHCYRRCCRTIHDDASLDLRHPGLAQLLPLTPTAHEMHRRGWEACLRRWSRTARAIVDGGRSNITE